MNAGDRTSAAALTASAGPVAAPAVAPPPAAQAAPAAPVLVVAAAAGTAVKAARPAPARTPRPAPQARPLAMSRTPPVRPPNNPGPTTAAPQRIAVRGGRVTGFVRHLNLIQVVCWQIAVVMVVLTVRQPWPVLVCASAGAAVLIALTAVRINGHWLYELGALAGGYLSRNRRRELPGDAGRAPALLDLLVPGCTVRSTATGHGPAMTTSHRGGLTAVLRPRSAATDLVGPLLTPAALLPVVDGQPYAFGVQTVCHTGVRRDGPAKVWLAVHAARGVEAPGDEELTLALRNAMRRVRGALRRAGVPSEPLAEDAAFAMIAGLAHVTGGRDEVREDWRFLRTGPVCQAVFQLRGWHRLTDPQARRLVGDLFAVTAGAAEPGFGAGGAGPSGIAGVAVTVTVSARSGHDGPRLDAVLRLAATTEGAVETALGAMAVRAASCGVRLARLDGAHSHGVAASLPIGVFLP